MDLNKLTVKELLAKLTDAGIEKPTLKEGLVAFFENQSRLARRRDQAKELAAIERKLDETNEGPELESLLQRTTKALLSGFDFSLPKLPKGLEVKMNVNMQLWHTRTEVVNQDDESGLQTPGSRSGNEMTMTNISMGRALEVVHGAEDEEELDGNGIPIILPPRQETKLSPNVVDSRKRKLASPALQITSTLTSKSEMEAGHKSNRQAQKNEQTLEPVPSNSKPATLRQSHKKQKRIAGRFA
ncbi:uncharacterized protein EAF01_002577 [Botrytis porri]|uniref:SAP domain-containing protein n=1 Tax=Botrytis porri TaxID=87229 RepID=A0A4Z1KKG7_9HELO|nr:uncharacterized protein EAF01_002577 [Botrytis porri]KAF7911069.1 hypothetical protein EAF01_002577 [Botrytis porri]TGO86567.1 hypothetical protein BPOR_0293g00140 [Botrytis porri]